MYTKLLPTLPVTYNDHSYWIDGKLPERSGEQGSYWYVIKRPGGVEVNSTETFNRVVDANTAARKAIELMAGVTQKAKPQILEAVPETEAEPKPRRRRRSS